MYGFYLYVPSRPITFSMYKPFTYFFMQANSSAARGELETAKQMQGWSIGCTVAALVATVVPIIAVIIWIIAITSG